MKICTILARKGSLGVVGKNTRILNGKPLISWSIEQALKSKIFDLIVVSSDSYAILEIGKDAGVDYTILRPSNLATSNSPKMPALYHCVKEAENFIGSQFTQIVDLQPTSPLRKTEDILNAVSMQMETNASSVITGTASKCSPYFSLVEENANGVVSLSKSLNPPATRRQDTPKCFDMNGSIYVFNRNVFMERQQVLYPDTKIYVMPEERSIDIDTELDFAMAEFLMNRNNHMKKEN